MQSRQRQGGVVFVCVRLGRRVVPGVGQHLDTTVECDADRGRERQHVDENDHVHVRGQGCSAGQSPLEADTEAGLAVKGCRHQRPWSNINGSRSTKKGPV
jgi:hypothetical protein